MQVYLVSLDGNRSAVVKRLLQTDAVQTVASLQDLPLCDTQDRKIVFDDSYLSCVADEVERLWALNERDIEFLIEDSLYALDKEEEILSKIEAYVSEENWGEVKKCNQALLFFDYVKRRAVQKGLPQYVQMETTDYCNAQCVMCRHCYAGNRDAKHLDFDMISNVEKILGFSRAVGLQGLGEPFLHPKFADVIDRYVQYGVKISATTNMSVLTERHLELINKHFANIQISYDGATKETFEYIRKGLNFDKVRHNIERLVKHCPDVYKEITVVLMRRNITELEDVVEFANSVNIKTVIFHNLEPNVVLNNYQESMVNYPAVLHYFCQRAYRLGKEKGIRVFCPVPFEEKEPIWDTSAQKEFDKMYSFPFLNYEGKENQLYDTEEALYKKADGTLKIKQSNVRCAGICDWLLNQAYISLDGEASVCCSRRIYKTGNVNGAAEYQEIWNGETPRKMREIFYSGYLPSCCSNCVLAQTNQLQFLRVYKK